MMLAGAGTEDGGWSWVIWWRRAVGAVADSEAPGESGFEDWGRDEFAFLAGHGFVVDRVTRHTIQWRKSGRTIELSRDWRDGVLDLRFVCGTGPSDRRAFGLHEALQVVAPEAWPSHGWQAWRQPTTRKYIAELAALVRAHAADHGYDRPAGYWSGPGRTWLASLDLPPASRRVIGDDLALIDALAGPIAALDE